MRAGANMAAKDKRVCACITADPVPSFVLYCMVSTPVSSVRAHHVRVEGMLTLGCVRVLGMVRSPKRHKANFPTRTGRVNLQAPSLSPRPRSRCFVRGADVRRDAVAITLRLFRRFESQAPHAPPPAPRSTPNGPAPWPCEAAWNFRRPAQRPTHLPRAAQ